ncbi:Ldh family oxidoreductase [Gilvimarinus sp. DZF01]|uniref:Ldh family oxidoreductase n=1 Tax=Gilvimarinus sp. DZF01 TaxID=3461371 RepID=UPI004045EADA
MILPARVSPQALHMFSKDLLCSAGSDCSEAEIVSEVLVWCDRVGRPNQGVWRLPVLCDRLERGLYETPCKPVIEMRGPSLALLDGRAGQGHFVAAKAMEHAIAIARHGGIGAVLVRNSNFFGAGAYYVNMAATAGMVGVALSNSFPKVHAYRGEQPVLGTNPLAFGCPAEEGRPLILDMATSAQAGSTVRRQQEESGRREPALIEPLGGAKGYGLGLMVEVLSGLLTGAGFSRQVNSMYENFQSPGNNGHFFLALDIESIMPLAQFGERMRTMVDWLRESGPHEAVKYPGEHRWEALRRSDEEGVHLDLRTRDVLTTLHARFHPPASQ